jgi:hypothetical protein
MRPYLEKNPSQIRAAGVAQGVGPEFKSQYLQNIFFKSSGGQATMD